MYNARHKNLHTLVSGSKSTASVTVSDSMMACEIKHLTYMLYVPVTIREDSRPWAAVGTQSREQRTEDHSPFAVGAAAELEGRVALEDEKVVMLHHDRGVAGQIVLDMRDAKSELALGGWPRARKIK